MRRTFHFGEYQCDVTIRSRGELYDGLDSGAFYIADNNTAAHLPGDVTRALLPPGEASKSWREVERLMGEMLAADLTRDSVVVGVGGGVVTDISAFAASLYMRGCRLVLVPTSLLAMVDAALGGKAGVNFGGFKNMVGSFYPAHEVRLCTDTLTTLSAPEYMSGLAEAIKTAMLGRGDLLELFEQEQQRILQRDASLLADIVWQCVQVKGELVEADLRETGVRAHLNLGHTFAHALESVNGLGTWSHGEAVAWGLARAMELGVAVGLTESRYARRIIRLLTEYGYRIDAIPEAAGAIQDAMKRDKKRQGGRTRFVLQPDLMETVVTEVDPAIVTDVLGGRAPLVEA